jgi:hypothetical protein
MDEAMQKMTGDEEPKWKRMLQPWKIAAVLLGIFLLSQAYFAWSDRFVAATLNSHPAFATPEFPLEFSKTIQYDPLTFVGRGARAGFWDWTPEGLVLTQEGSRHFRMEGDRIVSHAVAGRRHFARLRERVTQGTTERVSFFYAWDELTPPAVALLFPPPKLGDEYLASAVLARSGDGWEVTELETPDFDKPLQQLQAIASGVLR